MANINNNKVLNFSSKREQHQTCLNVAEREKNQGTKVLNRPPLRFPEFSGEWQKTTLGKNGYTYNGLSGKSATDFGKGFPYITYKSIFDNSAVDMKRVELVEVKLSEKQNEVKQGDIFFTTSSETPEEVGMSSVLLDNPGFCFLNSFCFGYRLNDTKLVLPEFMRFYLRSSLIRTRLRILAQGSTRFNISKGEVMKMRVSLPNPNEQAKIASFLSLIDDRISVQIGLIEDLKKLKSAIRKIVFKHIKGSVVALQDIANIYQPQTISSTDLTTDGYLVYGANGVIGHYSQYNHEKEQICITCRGNTCGTVNYTKPKSWITGNSMVINTDDYSDIVNRRFLYQYLSNINFQSIISGSGQPQIVRSPLAQLKIVLPSIDEQTKIAERLSAIEKKIAVETAVKDCYVRQRQYLLSQMFV